MSSAHPLLEVRKLTRTYGKTEVLRGISLHVEPGQVTCLLGPSGCGKSTTLRIIAGVEHQTSGAVLIDGQVVSDGRVHMPPEARGIGLMFQDFALFPHMSVVDNVAFGLSGTRADKRRRAEAMLERVNLCGFAEKAPHLLSGGEQQRVALARALAPGPRIILMDEPFSGLDNRLRDEVRDATLALLKEENAAVLLITHEPDEAMRMADRIALMRAGRIVQSAPPYTLYAHPNSQFTAGFFSDINILRAKVQNALCETPFGGFLAPGYPNGAPVDIVFRPQHVRIDFDRAGRGPNPTDAEGMPARAHVIRARFMGKESLIEFRMETGEVVSATVPQVFLPKPDTPFWLSIRRDRCFVYKTSN